MAHEHFLGFHKIGDIGVLIDSHTIEPRSCHVLASPAYTNVIECKLFALAVNLSNKSLQNGNPPAEGQLVPCKYLQQLLVPEVLAFSWHGGVGFFLGVAEGEVLAVAVVEIVHNDFVTDALQYPLAIGLVHFLVQLLGLEWHKFHVPDAVHAVVHECAHGLPGAHQAQVRLLEHTDDPDDQMHILARGRRYLTSQLLEFWLREDVAFGGEAINAEAGFLWELGADGCELGRWGSTKKWWSL
jgi:hypothetical protein